MRLSKSLGLAFVSLVAAQEWVAAPKGLEVVSSKLFNGAEISYKTSVCETTEGVSAYSGYVSLPKSLLPDFQHWDEKQRAHLFFWYFEARNNPSTAPTSIYIGGGPGSSSFDNTNGLPCSVNADSNSTALNKISWNKHVNMLYIDQPLGTGFSYVDLVNGTFDTLTQTFTPVKGDGLDLLLASRTPTPHSSIENFFNQPWVQRDLGVPLNFTTGVNNIGKVWLGQTGDIMIGNLHAVERVVERGVNVALIYADRDYRCPWYGGENISLSLNFPSASEFRSAGYTPIKTNCSYTAGFVREHGNISFSRIFESGHGVAGYQPEALSVIFNRVMSRRDLATGEVDLRKHAGYKTKGRKSVRGVMNKVPESPVNTCFVRDAPLSCTDEQLMALTVGEAKVKDWVVVEPKGRKPKAMKVERKGRFV
ncbi:Carboxypeptidase S1 like A [Fusarium agapanthi]|uniref:Carboxypeptidase S1 like A n=1 Tax=Fusarium agapanthi TaxID=1803897 RepID=A0A9P5E6T5_9HYPO|nr:Carboxypeptidase S1 like A [Fusarium agapanthi]